MQRLIVALSTTLAALLSMATFANAQFEVRLDPPERPANLIARPLWIEEPSQSDIAAAYPAAARQEGAGQVYAYLQCTAAADGSLGACQSNGTTATRFGPEFRDAALALVSKFRIGPADADGEQTAGRPVQFVIRFSDQ